MAKDPAIKWSLVQVLTTLRWLLQSARDKMNVLIVDCMQINKNHLSNHLLRFMKGSLLSVHLRLFFFDKYEVYDSLLLFEIEELGFFPTKTEIWIL